VLSRVCARLSRHAWLRKRVWHAVYEFLAARRVSVEWEFMNYGYVPGAGDGPPAVLRRDDESNRLQIAMYHQMFDGARCRGQKVLDIGCGRGGGLRYIQTYLDPLACTGVDFSSRAVTICRRRLAGETSTVAVAEADALPFATGRFDWVVNVESSHCYPSMERFVAEASRVLKPGGLFVIADFRDADEVDAFQRQLSTPTLRVVRLHDITANVVWALEHDSSRKEALIHRYIPGPFRGAVTEFAGVTGSRIHEAFRCGTTRYLSVTLKKTEAP